MESFKYLGNILDIHWYLRATLTWCSRKAINVCFVWKKCKVPGWQDLDVNVVLIFYWVYVHFLFADIISSETQKHGGHCLQQSNCPWTGNCRIFTTNSLKCWIHPAWLFSSFTCFRFCHLEPSQTLRPLAKTYNFQNYTVCHLSHNSYGFWC